MKRAFLLADPARKALPFDAYERALSIHVPKEEPDPCASVIVVEFGDEEPLVDR